jgi:hypothetical protein
LRALRALRRRRDPEIAELLAGGDPKHNGKRCKREARSNQMLLYSDCRLGLIWVGGYPTRSKRPTTSFILPGNGGVRIQPQRRHQA